MKFCKRSLIQNMKIWLLSMDYSPSGFVLCKTVLAVWYVCKTEKTYYFAAVTSSLVLQVTVHRQSLVTNIMRFTNLIFLFSYLFYFFFYHIENLVIQQQHGSRSKLNCSHTLRIIICGGIVTADFFFNVFIVASDVPRQQQSAEFQLDERMRKTITSIY